MSGPSIDFETGTPIWSAAIEHNTPNTPGLWLRAFNAEGEAKALEKAIELFTEEGLPPARIIRIEVTEMLTLPEGGEIDDPSSP